MCEKQVQSENHVRSIMVSGERLQEHLRYHYCKEDVLFPNDAV